MDDAKPPTGHEQHRLRFLKQADGVLREIDRLLAAPSDARANGLNEQDLLFAKAGVEKLKKRVRASSLPKPADRYRELTRTIIDQWPLGTKLGNDISDLEAFYGMIEE